jgi:hypothetical protein
MVGAIRVSVRGKGDDERFVVVDLDSQAEKSSADLESMPELMTEADLRLCLKTRGMSDVLIAATIFGARAASKGKSG